MRRKNILCLLRYDNGHGTLPGSLTWNEFCKFIKDLEDGVDNNGSSFLDVVRLRWIVNMAHGLRTNCSDRAAVQKFVRREATIWGVPDDSSLSIGRIESMDTPITEAETVSTTLAQLAIEVIRGEAAADDQMDHPNYKDNQYLKATEAALAQIHSGLECERTERPLNLKEAQLMIHAYPDLEPEITEILKCLSPNYDVRFNFYRMVYLRIIKFCAQFNLKTGRRE